MKSPKQQYWDSLFRQNAEQAQHCPLCEPRAAVFRWGARNLELRRLLLPGDRVFIESAILPVLRGQSKLYVAYDESTAQAAAIVCEKHVCRSVQRLIKRFGHDLGRPAQMLVMDEMRLAGEMQSNEPSISISRCVPDEEYRRSALLMSALLNLVELTCAHDCTPTRPQSAIDAFLRTYNAQQRAATRGHEAGTKGSNAIPRPGWNVEAVWRALASRKVFP